MIEWAAIASLVPVGGEISSPSPNVSSRKSFIIESAIATASRSLRNLEWFEVVDVRGRIRDNKVANYQVTLKLGLRYVPKA